MEYDESTTDNNPHLGHIQACGINIEDIVQREPLGIKHDAEKLEWSLLPLAEIEDVIKVLMHGKAKYSKDNWQYVKPKERYIDAAFRHLAARAQGEMVDKESGLSHMAHAACCCLFLMWGDKEENKNA